jgi:hypothetical protein
MTLIPELFTSLLFFSFCLSFAYAALPRFRRYDIFLPFQALILFVIISLFLMSPVYKTPVNLDFTLRSDLLFSWFFSLNRLVIFSFIYVSAILFGFLKGKNTPNCLIPPFFFFALVLFSGNEKTSITGILLFLLSWVPHVFHTWPKRVESYVMKRPEFQFNPYGKKEPSLFFSAGTMISLLMLSLFLIASFILIMIQVGS